MSRGVCYFFRRNEIIVEMSAKFQYSPEYLFKDATHSLGSVGQVQRSLLFNFLFSAEHRKTTVE